MIKVFINISNVKILHCWYCELLKRSKTHSTASSHITHWQLRGAGARRSCSRPDLLIGRRLPVDLWPGLLGFCRLVADWEEELKTQVMMISPVFLRQMKWQSVGKKKNNNILFRYLGDGAHGFGATLPEHQLLVTVQVLWRLNEAEVNQGLVPRPQTRLVHGQDGGRLSDAAAVNWDYGESDRRRPSSVSRNLEF